MSSPQPEPESPPTAIPTQSYPHPPPIIQALSYSPLKKPQPIPWSHEETLNLIKAYQEKWYSLKRGQLKASQWEEVAVTVAARCGLDEPSKSATQCRHKIEKLRKRYRVEKHKLPPSFTYQNHPWIYFSLMDQLERGPLPISAVPPLRNDDHLLQTDDDFQVGFGGFAKLRGGSSNLSNNSDGILRKGQKREDLGNLREDFDGFLRTRQKREDLANGYKRGGADFNGGSINLRDLKKRKSYYEDDQDDDGDEMNGHDLGEKEMKGDDDLLGELGAQIREFAERFLRVEVKKIELMKETERLRLEMENKRMEMIIVAQHNIVELISKAFNGNAASCSATQKKMKIVTTDL